MKSKLFKKIIAGAMTLAMAAQFAFVLPASAADTYYTLDFENETTENVQSANGGWHETYRGRLTIESDSNSTIGKYLQFTTSSGDGGNRETDLALPADVRRKDGNNTAVLEFDMKMTSGSMDRIQQIGFTSAVNKAKNAIYSGNDYILLLTQAKDGSVYINNGALTDQVADGGDIPKTAASAWVHVKAVLDYTEKSIFLTVKSLDGQTEYYKGNTMFGETAADIQYLLVTGARNGRGNVAIDNIVVRERDAATDPIERYYTVTYKVDGTVTSESVKDGDPLAKVPANPTKLGYQFDGWSMDGSEDLLEQQEVEEKIVTAHTTFEAVFSPDPNYIEPLASVDIDVPNNGVLSMGTTDTDFVSNEINLKLTGEIGRDIAAKPDARVEDYAIKWSFDGFKVVVSENGRPTAENEAEGTYCDTYAKIDYNNDTPTSKADFKVSTPGFNYYGRVKVEVTYNGKKITAEKPLAILPNKTQPAGQLLPKAGYVQDITPYDDNMVGYKAVISGDNRSATDVATGDWAAYGGNNDKNLVIAEENEEKYFAYEAKGTNSSSIVANHIGTAPTGQVVVEQDMRFYQNTDIRYKSVNPVTWTTGAATSFDVSFDGSKLSLNGTKITDAEKNKWYHITVIADVSSKKCYAIVSDETGELGKTAVVAFQDGGSLTPTYLCYQTPDNAAGKIDFKNARVYIPEVSDAGLTLEAEEVELTIPEDTTPATTTLTVSGKSADGYDMIGQATWTVVDAPEDITITPDATNPQKAKLSVGSLAQPGTITIRAALGGATKETKITLKGTKDSLGFTESPRSISIPFNGDDDEVAKYVARVVDKDGNPIDGKEAVYTLYNADNSAELTTLPEGIAFDAEKGTITVSSSAKATVVYIHASSTNSSGEPLERAIKVVIHGLFFDLGTDEINATATGYTAIAPTTVYSDANGYGISAGSATAGGTADATDATKDNLAGNFTFQAKVKPGRVYNVVVNYTGSAVSEYVNSDLTGVPLAAPSNGKGTYEIPVVDGVLDLRFTNATVSSIEITPQAEKQPRTKPHLFSSGDSTLANNGSWAYVLNRDQGQYTDFAALVDFSQNGRGGKNLSTYYTDTSGNNLTGLLLQIQPGDFVTLGNWGTNGMGNDFEATFNYYIDALEAMGAYVILNSYSPHGAVGGYENDYNSVTHTFNSYRKDGYDVIVRGIYAERTDKTNAKYDPNIAGFVDIGKMADAAFNAYVADYEKNGYANENEAAKAIIKCFGDHNHYSNGTIACQLMLNGYEGAADGIVKTLVNILSNKYEISSVAASRNGENKIKFTATDKSGNGTQTLKLIVAQYVGDALVGVSMKDGVFSNGTSAIDVEYTAVDGAKVKAFAWDNMKPLLANTAVTDAQ